jgi:AraC-like DNA-binding protein
MKKLLISVEQDVEVADYIGTSDSADPFDCSPRSIYIVSCKTGQINIHTSFIPHPITLSQGEVIFLAFPKGSWGMNIKLQKKSHYYIMSLTLEKLHALISASFSEEGVNRQENFNYQDLMKVLPISPATVNIFDQLLYNQLRPPFQKIFVQAKFLELFSLIMNSSFGNPIDACPVIINREVEQKLQQARRYVIEHIHLPPDPDALAVELEIPRNTLKEGFKYIYGKSIHQFHSDYKMEAAMSMLKSGTKLVKEIAYDIGYQNPSHFIAAFKRKYGKTPKQYLKGN